MAAVHRWGPPLVAAALTLCAPSPGAYAQTARAAVLDVVVDSLPFAIANTWGFEEDRPYTVHLEARQLVPRGRDQIRMPRPGEKVIRSHPAEWLSRQTRKGHVLGVCESLSDDAPCRQGDATMSARLSTPAFDGPDVASVEVLLGREEVRNGQPSVFFTVVQFDLIRVDGSWRVSKLTTLLIT